MREFNWEEFKSNKIAVNCKTEDEAIDFLKECLLNEVSLICKIIKDKNGSSRFCVNDFDKDICYSFDMSRNRLIYNSYEYYKVFFYKIIEWSSYMRDINKQVAGLKKEVQNERN